MSIAENLATRLSSIFGVARVVCACCQLRHYPSLLFVCLVVYSVRSIINTMRVVCENFEMQYQPVRRVH
jgi:hypothetical protein